MAEHCYADCHLCTVTNKPFMLSVIMLNVVMARAMVPYTSVEGSGRDKNYSLLRQKTVTNTLAYYNNN